jgi:2-iminobutanoate/2-iminopropanoate deaminase
MRTPVILPETPADGLLTPAILASGRLLFISGQGPVDRVTGQFVLGDFEAQLRLTLDNLAHVAAVAGATLADAVKVNAYIRDTSNLGRYNEIYREYFHGVRPARTTVQSDLPGFEIEIEAVIDMDPGVRS